MSFEDILCLPIDFREKKWYNLFCAGVMELADVPDSKSGPGDRVRVRPPPPAPNSRNPNPKPVGEGFGFLFVFGDI